MQPTAVSEMAVIQQAQKCTLVQWGRLKYSHSTHGSTKVVGVTPIAPTRPCKAGTRGGVGGYAYAEVYVVCGMLS